MGIDAINPVNVSSAAPASDAPERSAAEAYRICRDALESIGDRQHVLHEILYPMVPEDGASLNTLRQRMLADIPQDGAQANLLDACLPDDAQVLCNILDKLIAHFR